MDPAYARVSASEHEEIAAAILAGDGARAERAMRNHVGSSGRAMIAAAREAEARRAEVTHRVPQPERRTVSVLSVSRRYDAAVEQVSV